MEYYEKMFVDNLILVRLINLIENIRSIKCPILKYMQNNMLLDEGVNLKHEICF